MGFMSHKARKCPMEERGVSEVVGVILMIGLLIAVFTAFYPIWRQNEIKRLEVEHMNAIRNSFLDLKSRIEGLGVGDSTSVNLKLSRNTIAFGPDSPAAPNLSGSPALLITKKINPDNDGYVCENLPQSNFGTDSLLQVASTEENIRRAFLRFSLENIPTGAIILNADLWLYCGSSVRPLRDVTDIRCYPVENDGWSEGDLSWENQPLREDEWRNALDSLYVGGEGWISMTVKDFVARETTGDRVASLGLRMKQEGSEGLDRYVSFLSKDAADETKRPYLEVMYAVGRYSWVQTDWSGGEQPGPEVVTWEEAYNYNRYYTGVNVSTSQQGEIRLATGALTGYLESSIYDAGETVDWGRISWDASTPSESVFRYVQSESVTEGGTIDFDNAKADDGNYENIYEISYGIPRPYNPSGYTLLDSTRRISGTIENVASDNAQYMTFRSYVSAYSTTTNSRAFISYRVQTGGGRTPQYRNYDGTSWDASASQLGDSGSPLRHVRVAYSTVSSRLLEKIVVTLSDDGYLDAYVWDGTSWIENYNIGRVWTVAPWGANRPYDIAYEKTSGRALLVYGNVLTDPTRDLSYRIWDGSSWSDEYYIDDTTGHAGHITVSFVDLATNPVGGSNQIGLIYIDSTNSDAVAKIWTGSGWASEQEITGTVSITTEEAITIAYEQISGNLIAVAGQGSFVAWSRYTTSWSTPETFDINPGAGGAMNWLVLKADPSSDRLMLLSLDASGDACARDWTGSGWGIATILDSWMETTSTRALDGDWEPTGSKFVAVGGNRNVDPISYKTWTPAGGWSPSATNTWFTYRGLTTDQRWVQVRRDQRGVGTAKLWIGTIDDGSDLVLTRWDGSGMGGQIELTNNVGTLTYESFEIEFQLFGDPTEFTAGVEFTGTSDTDPWDNIVVTVDSQWTATNVDVTIQLWDYNQGIWAPSGSQAYLSYTSGTANTDETKTLTITTTPENYRDANGNWRVRVSGVKGTGTQFDLKVDWAELKPSPSAYRMDVEHQITGIPTSDTYELQIEYYTAGDSEQINILIYKSGSWEPAGNLQTGGSPSSPLRTSITLDPAFISGGTVRLRYRQPDNDPNRTSLIVDYCRVATFLKSDITVEVRTGETVEGLLAGGWLPCVKGGDIPAENRYIQYRVELQRDIATLEPVFREISINYLRAGAGALPYGGVEFIARNDFFPSQTYIYETGGVIVIQGGVDLMVSGPSLVSVSDAGGGNIRVDVNVWVIENKESSTASTGTATIRATCKSSRYVVAPVDGQPNREDVEITIWSNYPNAWGRYLEDLRAELIAKGYDVEPLVGLTLIIHGKAGASGNDIYYYEKLNEIEVTVS